MKQFLLTTLFFFSCFYAQARHLPEAVTPEKPLLGHFCQNCSNSHPEKFIYLVETQQGYIAFLASESCQSLYPLGYVDGMSLYNAYFAERFALDPSGNLTKPYQRIYPHDETGAGGPYDNSIPTPPGPSVIITEKYRYIADCGVHTIGYRLSLSKPSSQSGYIVQKVTTKLVVNGEVKHDITYYEAWRVTSYRTDTEFKYSHRARVAPVDDVQSLTEKQKGVGSFTQTGEAKFFTLKELGGKEIGTPFGKDFGMDIPAGNGFVDKYHKDHVIDANRLPTSQSEPIWWKNNTGNVAHRKAKITWDCREGSKKGDCLDGKPYQKTPEGKIVK